MWLDFAHPLLLGLLIPCGLIVWLTARRNPSRTMKSRISHGLRYVLVALTVLAIADVRIPGSADQKAAWLLIDASASMAGSRDAVARMADQALTARDQGRKVGVIVFGGDAMVESSLSDEPDFTGVTAAVDASGSNLSQAISLASALLPSDAQGGIAVISDGLVDSADGAGLRERDIPVNALKVDTGSAEDAQVTRVDVPDTAYQGQTVSISVTIHSTVQRDATLILLANGKSAATRDVSLSKGENTFVFRNVAAVSGVVTYEARIVMPGDGVPQNDRTGAYVAVQGAPSILIVEGQSGAGSELGKMLRAVGMEVETVLPASVSGSAAELRAFHGVAMVNVDADALSGDQLSALEAAVREMGVGLAVFGGDSSYALGNYRGSALERMLPVTIDVKNRMNLPSTALVLVIDKSGSMTDGQYGVTRLDVAKEAACRALEVLTERDQAGVIAFDEAGKWVVPLAPVTDVAQMQNSIGTIRPGGGTAFYTPLAMAFEALSQASARHKHVIFLTDGEAADRGYDGLAEGMARAGITLTTVAVGDGADLEVMRRLAELGNGRAYAAGEFDNVPKIFTKETLLVAGTYVQNRTFTPVVTDASLTDYPGFPTLDGYLATTERPLATVSLVSDREDPILAWWQYGAGCVLCWTSDVQGGWSRRFLDWDDAASFFGGLISHVLPAGRQDGEMQLEDGVLCYTSKESIDGAEVSAQVIGPDGLSQTVELEQVAPTRYEAALETGEAGAYAVQVRMRRDGETIASLDGGAVIPYAREYDQRVSDRGALEKLCDETGGAAVQSAANLLDFPRGNARTWRSLRIELLCAALALFLLDVAQQRLHWERSLPKKQVTPQRSREFDGLGKRSGHAASQKSDYTQTTEQLWQNHQKKKRL